MITMGRGEFKMFIFNVVEHCDDESFQGLCELFLTACGVIDQEENLTKEYAESPYWTVNDGKLERSEYAVKIGEMLGGNDGVRTERDKEGV